MASIKIILRNKPNKDGTHSLALQILKDRVQSIVHIGHSIEPKYWDAKECRIKKSHPNSARLNNLIAKKLSEANEKLIELETNKNDVSSKAIQTNIKAKNNSSFFAQAAVYLDNIKTSGRYNRYTSEEPRVRKFKEFLEEKDVTFQEINVALLNKFKAYLKGKLGLSERTVMNYFILIRTIYNQAIKANLADIKHYPFGRDKIVIKNPESVKIGLSPEEVKKMEGLNLSDKPYLHHARNLWLISFYFAGMRVSDVLRLKWTDFQNDRLHYSMGKNNKAGSLKIPEKVNTILAQYKKSKKNKHDLVFPELEVVEDLNNLYEVQRKISFAVKNLNDALIKVAKEAGITKKLTTHIARHTFGNISGDKISPQMLQKLYRHSSITTTIGYQANFIHKDADEALDAVIGK
ncbi:MAG: site-specific integrase [Bacteroidetes bacterium]|nr:site-specific integrase [Bacteroidota bacterium]